VLELDHIPLTPSGKLRKRDIVDWIAQGRVVPAPVSVQVGNDAGKVARG
jgi:hypothetical protein